LFVVKAWCVNTESEADHPRMRASIYAWSLLVTWRKWRPHHSIRHSLPTPCYTRTSWLCVL